MKMVMMLLAAALLAGCGTLGGGADKAPVTTTREILGADGKVTQRVTTTQPAWTYAEAARQQALSSLATSGACGGGSAQAQPFGVNDQFTAEERAMEFMGRMAVAQGEALKAALLRGADNPCVRAANGPNYFTMEIERSDNMWNTIGRFTTPLAIFGVARETRKNNSAVAREMRLQTEAVSKVPNQQTTSISVEGDGNALATDRSGATMQRDVAGSATSDTSLDAPELSGDAVNADNGSSVDQVENKGKNSNSGEGNVNDDDETGNGGLF